MSTDGGAAPASGAHRVVPTKLFVPRRRQTAVARPELVARIEQGTWRPLTLVVAPAGYGKTTLVSQWIDATRLPVAWVSLDPDDNDPLRFLSYVLAAIGRVRPGVPQLCGAAPSDGVDLAALLDELLVIPLAEEPDAFALVLDDLHELTAPGILAALDRLLDNLPPCLHVVLTSRVEPALSLATRRARDAVTDIVAADLAFSPTDARAFFDEAMGLALDDEAVALLRERTEGWVAGMQLAGLSMKRGALPEEVLRGLAGDGDVAEFLGREVLDALDADHRDFLLDTCVLDRLCEPLCEAVTERASAAGALRAAIREGMFLVPLDHGRSWYRYHQLFRDLVRRRLRAEAPEREALLHRRAARWWMSEGDPASAATHAAQAGAHDLVGAIVARWGMPALLGGDRPTVERWLAALPDAALDTQPFAATLAGWMAVLPVRAPPRTAAALAAVTRARAALAITHVPDAQRAELDGHLVAITAIATRPVDDPAAGIAHAAAALAEVGEHADSARTVLALQLGVLHVMLGQPRAALEPLAHAETWGRASGNVFAGVAAMAYRAWSQRWLGELDDAEETCRSATALADRAGVASTGVTGHVHVERARLHFDRWELSDALASLDEALPRARLLSDPFLLVTALVLQARVRDAAGEVQLADLSAREAGDAADGAAHPLLRAWARACRWRLALARRLAPEAPVPSRATYRAIEHDGACCGVLAAIDRGEHERALAAADPLVDDSRAAGRVTHAIDWELARAAALAAAGREAEATQALAAAVACARPRRLVRPFVESRRRIAPIVDALDERDRGFLTTAVPVPAAPASAPPTAGGRARRAGVPPLAEPLSPREVEVLGLVRDGRSNAEIADALFVSLGTIKTHMHRLMTKLGAKNRVEALRLAEDHGLIVTRP